MSEEQNRFSLRKLSVGLASVLIGVSIFGTSQTVKADTVANNQTSSVTNNAQSSDTQENKNVAKSSFSNDNQANNAKSNLIQTQVEAKKDQKQDSVPKTQEVNDSSNLDAEKSIVRTSSLQEPDNQSNNHAENNSQTQTSQKLDLTKNSPKFARKVLATNLIETNSSPMTNGGFDEATWGKLDVTKWQGQAENGVYQLTSYTGDPIHVIVPNEADFEKAGKSTNGLQVGITRDTVSSIFSNQTQTIAFSKTDNQKVKAIGTDWSYAFSFSHKALNKFDGSNLDVSSVTNMSYMFDSTSISDLTSLANWDTSKVTNMSSMFQDTSISDLTPLAHWDTSKVTNMSSMFQDTSISDLTPLAHWDTSKVTNMSYMFYNNSISNLTPLTNWNTSKVTDMSFMFENNSISNLTPLTNWNTSKVTDMSFMFENNSISNLTGLDNWDTSKVTDMRIMFGNNPDIIDLRPIANWNISSIITNIFNVFSGLAGLFDSNNKLNLTNINNTPLMQGFLKTPDALADATFITNNTDLVKNITDKDLPTLTNTAKRTITFNIPNDAPKTIVQIINYKTIATVQIDWSDPSDSGEIVKTYPVKESDWQLDTSKQNDDVIIDGAICFKPVKIPHINGYKAHLVRNKLNPALFMVSFMAVPTENKPSLPDEVAPSKPSAPTDNPNHSAWTNLDHKVVDVLNQSDSGWTMPTDVSNSTYTVEVPDDAIIDLSDLVIAEPVHAQTRTQIRVNKRFKLRKHGKKHVAKHLKHRKKAVKSFKKYRL